MIRDKNNIETPVHHKATNNNIYFNWISHAPNKWKVGTLWTFVRKGYDICSTNEHLQNELCYIKKVFREQYQYSFWTINKVFCEIKQSNHQQLQEQHQQHLPSNSSHEEVPNRKKHFLLLPYKGKKATEFFNNLVLMKLLLCYHSNFLKLLIIFSFSPV